MYWNCLLLHLHNMFRWVHVNHSLRSGLAFFQFAVQNLSCLYWPVNEDNNFSGTTDLLTSAVLIAGLFLFLPVSFPQSHADTHLNLNHVLSLKKPSVFPPIMTLVSIYDTCCSYCNLISHVGLAVVLAHRYSHTTRLSLSL